MDHPQQSVACMFVNTMTTKKREVPQELLAALLADSKKLEDLIGENGLFRQFIQLKVGKALDVELTAHLGHERHEAVANFGGNTRNGNSREPPEGESGELPITPALCDRQGTLEPQLITSYQARWVRFDKKLFPLSASGVTVCEIQSHLKEMYSSEVSPSLIFSVTDAVADEVKVWAARPSDATYPNVYTDCIHVKVREGAIRVKAVYDAISIHKKWRE